jgi:hypothetical protein
MKKLSLLILIAFAFMAFPQTSKITGGIILAAPAPEDTTDHKLYVPPVPACTVIIYPVIREHLNLGKGDKVKLILRTNPKDSSSFTELWQWDYKQKEKDSSVLMIKANFIDK